VRHFGLDGDRREQRDAIPIATNFLIASIVGISTGIRNSTRFFLNVSITRCR
jgi:hypothetical protein